MRDEYAELLKALEGLRRSDEKTKERVTKVIPYKIAPIKRVEEAAPR